MFKVVKTKTVLWGKSKVKPLVNLTDEYGGKAAIINDDHCLVLLLNVSNDGYKPTVHWFREAVDAIPDARAEVTRRLVTELTSFKSTTVFKNSVRGCLGLNKAIVAE